LSNQKAKFTNFNTKATELFVQFILVLQIKTKVSY